MPVHVIKKGDTLIKIAKQYGIKDWRKGLYEHKDNQAFKRKNPDPEVLPLGEKLMIPEPEGGADPKEAAREEAIAEKRVKVEAVIARLKRVRKEIEIVYTESAKQSESIFSEMKKMSDGVDLAATIATLCVGLTKLGIKWAQVTKASAAEAAKLADDLAADTAKDIGKRWVEAAGYMVKAAPAGDSTVWLFGQSVADAWFKLNSPSFWAHTYVQIAKEGKSWSEAVTYDPAEEHKEALAKLETARAEALRSVDEKIKEYERVLASLKKAN